MAYTDGAYASEANVLADLKYLGVATIRDSVPNPNGGVPAYNQAVALQALGAAGIKFDLLTYPSETSVPQIVQEVEQLNQADPGAVIAVEGPNEINNSPVTYDGLTGQAAATAFQDALYSAITTTPATAGIAVYDFTGGVSSPLTVAGSISRNANGSYTLVSGQTGFPVNLPVGTSTITLTFTGAGYAGSGVFGYPGSGQKSGVTYSNTGTISYTFNNTSGAMNAAYIDFSDYGNTDTVTGVNVTGPGSSTNLVTFDPSLSLAGEATDANVHPYPNGNASIKSVIASNYQTAYGSATPGPRVITETGYTTDPNASNGVTQTVQAQQIINGLLDAYQSGVSMTYIYELLDELPDPNNSNSQMHYGLFTNGNTPKLAAVALHDLTTILADGGSTAATFTTGSLNYSETGTVPSDNAMLMQKSSGVFDLALWNDGDAGTSKSNNVKVALGGTYQTVKVYDVVTDAEKTYKNVSSVTVAVGSDPMIVEVDPNTASITTGSVHAATTLPFLAAAVSTSTSASNNLNTAATPAIAGGMVATQATTSNSVVSGLLAAIQSATSSGWSSSAALVASLLPA